MPFPSEQPQPCSASGPNQSRLDRGTDSGGPPPSPQAPNAVAPHLLQFSAHAREAAHAELVADLTASAQRLGAEAGSSAGLSVPARNGLAGEMREFRCKAAGLARNDPQAAALVRSVHLAARRQSFVSVMEQRLFDLALDAGISRCALGGARAARQAEVRLESALASCKKRLQRAPSVVTELEKGVDTALALGTKLRVRAEHSAAELHRCTARWARDHARTVSILEPLSDKELQVTAQVYEERYGRPLAARVDAAFRPGITDWICGQWAQERACARHSRILNLLAGRRADAAADAIAEIALTPLVDNIDRMRDVLEGRSAAESLAVQQALFARYRPILEGRPADARAPEQSSDGWHPEFSPLDRHYLQALVNGRPELARAIYIKLSVLRADRMETIYDLLASLTPAEVRAAAEAFDAEFYRPEPGFDFRFRDFIAEFMPFSPQKKRVLALIEDALLCAAGVRDAPAAEECLGTERAARLRSVQLGHLLRAEALRVAEGLRRYDGDLVSSAFLGKSREYRLSLHDEIRSMHVAPLGVQVSRAPFAAVDKELLTSAAENGRFSEVALLRHALLLRDAEAVKRLLEGKSRDEMRRLAAAYGERDSIAADDPHRVRDIAIWLRSDIFPRMLERSAGLRRLTGQLQGMLRGMRDACERDFPWLLPPAERITRGLARCSIGLPVEPPAQHAWQREMNGVLAALHRDLGRLTGAAQCDVLRMSYGEPESAAQLADHLRWTRSDAESGWLVPRLLRRWTRTGRMAARDAEQLEMLLQNNAADEREIAHLRSLWRVARVHLDELQKLKIHCGEEAAKWASGLLLIPLSWGVLAAGLPPAAEICGAVAAAMGSRAVLRLILTGESYSARLLGRVFLNAAVDGFFLHLPAGLRNLAAKNVLVQKAVRLLAKIGSKKLLKFGFKERHCDKISDEVSPETARDVVVAAALAALRV